MRIAILGAGNVGSALGGRWAAAGHEVVFGVRNSSSAKVRSVLKASGAGARAASTAEAVAGADVVVLATPWSSTEAALSSAGDLDGKIVIDCTNPLASLEGLEIGHSTSGGEQVAAWAPGAKVVKTFNTTGANNMADPGYGGARLVMPICGDDAEAKAAVAGLVAELGFEPLDAGPLARARQLEQLAVLWIALAYQQGLGREFGFVLARRR